MQQQPPLLILQLFDAGTLHLRFTLPVRHRLRMAVPRMLPLRERLLAAHQPFGGSPLLFVCEIEIGDHGAELRAQCFHLGAVPLNDAVSSCTCACA